MARSGQAAKKRPAVKQGETNKPVRQAEPTSAQAGHEATVDPLTQAVEPQSLSGRAPEVSPQTPPVDPTTPLALTNGVGAENQATLLQTSPLLAVQRQAIARQIGRTQGNRHLQRVISTGLVQRHSSTPLEYEEDSVQAKRTGNGAVQRHSSTPLEYEEDSVQAKRLPGALIQRDLIDDLNKAMDGWGSDKGAMKTAISNASATDKQRALDDPRLIARLRSELSRGDAIEILGDLGAPLSRRLETALNGWGADSKAILKMINDLPVALASEKLDVLRNPGLMTRLKSELSRADALKALAGLGASLAERFYAAMDGWGADETMIVELATKATDPEKQAAIHDRALIDRLKSEISSSVQMQNVLEKLGVSLIDRLNVAMDGWGVDSASILAMTSTAKDDEKLRVLHDTATVARLRDELSRPHMMTVMANLKASLADRIRATIDGWGADKDALLALIPGTPEADRMTVYADTALMARLQSELSAADYKQVSLLLRFGTQEAIDAATEEQRAAIVSPTNLTALLSGEAGKTPPDTAKMITDITAATAPDKELVRSNSSLMERLATVFTPADMRQVLQLLGVGIIDRLNLLITQKATAVDILALVNGATPDDKQLVLNNRALLDRLLELLGPADEQAVLTALGDSLSNQIHQVIVTPPVDITAVYTLIRAAAQPARDEVKLNSTLLTELSTMVPAISYWKARLLLDYGTEASYPASLPGLITAWEASSAAADIRRTIANLPTPDFNVIRNVVGIRDVLRALVSDDSQYMIILRMIDQGLITDETISGSVPETLQIDDPDTPQLDFVPRSFTAAQGFDVAYYRDRVQVDIRVKLDAKDDKAKTDLSGVKTTWEGMIETAWDNKYKLQNAIHTLPIRVNCNFTDGNPHHTVNVRSDTNPSWPAYNQGNWYYAATNYSAYAPIHEFGHMLGNPDEYNVSAADYQTTVGTDPTTDGLAVKETDAAGKERFTNPSVMGSNAGATGGSVEKRHLNYFTNWINSHRRTNADGTFVDGAFTLV